MRANFDHILTTIDGKPFTTSPEDQTPFTVRAAVANALLMDTDKNKSSKMERYGLFVRVKSLGESVFDVKEVALMREAILETYNTFISGQVVDVLDGTSRIPPEPAKAVPEEGHG